ncbi:MAG: glycosyltransferase family 9 protein [Muribaculaceae bacterium]|nr:glycosyltransferase family 9 protein [Muribaculaceae bacterium]
MLNSDKERRVMVVRFSALGDVALVIPALYDVCRSNPSTEFVMLTRPHPAELFINPPANLKIEGVDLDQYRGLGGILRLFREMLKKYRFTDIVDLHDVLRTRVMGFWGQLHGVRLYRFRKGRFAKKALTRQRKKMMVALRPTYERYRDAFRRAGLEVSGSFSSIFPAGYEEPSTPVPPKKDGEFRVAIAPFSRHEGKIYPLDQMRKVVDQLAASPSTTLLIFGFGEEEERVIDSWIEGKKNIFNLASLKLGLARELELLNHCDVMVSMDSANMHIASLVGLRTVSVWGATHPYTGFLGYGQRQEDAVQLDMTCRPCSVFGNKPCRRGDYHCLRGIAPERIIERIKTPVRDSV